MRPQSAIDHVTVSVPNEYTPNVQRVLSGRRGRILGYSEKPGWPGWEDYRDDLVAFLEVETQGRLPVDRRARNREQDRADERDHDRAHEKEVLAPVAHVPGERLAVVLGFR